MYNPSYICLKFMIFAMMVMMICRTMISQTSNSSSSGSGRAKEEPKKGKSSKYKFQDDWHVSFGSVVQNREYVVVAINGTNIDGADVNLNNVCL